MKLLTALSALFTILISPVAISADTTIEMLNKLEKETMVFSQKIVNIDVGDTVFWKSTDPGHNLEFISKG